MKKLYILLALLMALGMTWAVAETYTNEDWDYTLLEDGTAEIVSYSGGAVELIIPSELDGYTITSIGDEAFYGCTELTCITIPDSITNIGVAPFDDCWELTEFLISPEHPRLSAVEGVLFDTKEKRLIFYPASCTAVSYEIPFGTKIIGKSAFDCSELVSITIPQSVTTIEDEAFSNCRSLTSITIPDSTNKIGTNPFIDCS